MACNVPTVPFPFVTRIPIAGPAPYNTLVTCFFTAPPNYIPKAGSHVTRLRASFTSPFFLAGFSQANPAPQFVHTTCAWLRNAGPGNFSIFGPFGKDQWELSLDSIVGCGFDDTGCFCVDIDVAMMPPNPNSPGEQIISIFSHILVTEPQPGPPTHGKRPPPVPLVGHHAQEPQADKNREPHLLV